MWYQLPVAGVVDEPGPSTLASSADATVPAEVETEASGEAQPEPAEALLPSIEAEPGDAIPWSARTDAIEAPVAAEQEARRARGWKVGWVALAGVVVVVLAALGIFKTEIVALWPPAGRLYAAIGWPARPGYGLQLSGITVSPSTNNGQPILVLTGKIADISMVALTVPKLHVYLLADNQQVLRRLEMDSGKANLRPGETVGFSLNIDDPPREASSVRVAFAIP